MLDRPRRGTKVPDILPKFVVLKYLVDGTHSVVLNTTEELKKKRLIIPDIYLSGQAIFDQGKDGVLSHKIFRSLYQATIVVSSGKL